MKKPNLAKMLQEIIDLKNLIKQHYEKNLTIFFSDIHKYVEKSKSSLLGNVGIAVMLKELDNLVTAKAQDNGGYRVKTIGDAHLLTFARPDDAVKTAISVQNDLALQNEKRTEAEQVHIRIGINTGLVVEDEERDVIGNAVNIASRIENACLVDSILIGEATYQCLSENLKVCFKQCKNPLPIKHHQPIVAYYYIKKDDPSEAQDKEITHKVLGHIIEKGTKELNECL